MKQPEERHARIVEQQEGVPPDPKAKRMDDEREDEQEEGLAEDRRGSVAAPSDKPEGDLPHPQDVNEISDTRG